jgi:hypothetical protein
METIIILSWQGHTDRRLEQDGDPPRLEVGRAPRSIIAWTAWYRLDRPRRPCEAPPGGERARAPEAAVCLYNLHKEHRTDHSP